MTEKIFNAPLNAELIDGEVVITGPDGLRGAMSLEAAQASLANLQRALEAAGAAQETYQKPLG